MRGSVAIVVLLLSSTAFPALAGKQRSHIERAPESAAAGNFDGSWVIEAATTVGQCAPLVPTALTIQGARIVQAAGAPTTPWGYVEGDGTIVARFTGQGGHMARANGALRGVSGSGAWSSNTDYCGGTWRARRENATSAAR